MSGVLIEALEDGLLDAHAQSSGAQERARHRDA